MSIELYPYYLMTNLCNTSGRSIPPFKTVNCKQKYHRNLLPSIAFSDFKLTKLSISSLLLLNQCLGLIGIET